MKISASTKENNVATVLRRMRESAGLTMRQVGAVVGISHVAISQFENRKLDLPEYRIEQLVKAYGLTLEDFNKLMGRTPMGSPKADCRAMIDRMDEEQLTAVRAILSQILRTSAPVSATQATKQMPQIAVAN